MNPLKKIFTQRGDIALFIISITLMAFSESIVNTTLNNFLNDSFMMNSLRRTVLEFPRELPGFLVIFVTAALFFLPNRRLGAFAALLGGAGLLCLGLLPSTFHIMAIWLFLYSLGQHVFMPMISGIGMELAEPGKTGKRLGQINSIRNIAMIAGSFFIFLGFSFLHLNYKVSFSIAAVIYFTASLFLFSMNPGKAHPPAMHLKLHKEYGLFYWLSILFGTRKQIFLTFAPWVLVTVYHEKTALIAALFTAGSVLGVVFQPLLGKAIDTLGEKKFSWQKL